MVVYHASPHTIFVDRSDSIGRTLVAEPLEWKGNDVVGWSDWTMGFFCHGSGKHSGVSGNSSTWTVGGPWPVSLGEASHVYQPVADYAGVGARESVPVSDDLVGRFGGDVVGKTEL